MRQTRQKPPTPSRSPGSRRNHPITNPFSTNNAVLSGRRCNTFLPVMEDSDITRKPRPIPIQRRRPRDIASRIPMRCQQHQYIPLNLKPRHAASILTANGRDLMSRSHHNPSATTNARAIVGCALDERFPSARTPKSLNAA